MSVANDVSGALRSGTFWTFVAHFTTKVLGLGVGVVLARALDPADFGIVAVAFVVWELIRLFGTTGIGSKLIQQQGEVQAYAQAGFWLNLAVASLIALLGAALAPLAAAFYETPEVEPILRLLALGLVISALGSTHSALLSKAMAFKPLSIVNLVVDLISRCTALAMALTGFGLWSLVIPNLAVAPIRVAALWALHPFRPTLSLHLAYWKEIYRFGRYVLGTSVLRYVNINADYMVIGKLLGTQSLGLYSFAYNLANWPVENLVWVVNRVTFPAFSKLQNDLDAMKALLVRVVELISLIAFPMLFGLIAVAGDLVPVVYGEKWKPAVLPLQVILGFTLIRSVVALGGQVLIALGQPHTEFRFNALQVVPLLVAVFVGAQYGIVGVAVGMVSVLSVFGLSFLRLCAAAVGLRLTDIGKVVFPAMASSLVMGLTVGLTAEYLRARGYAPAAVLATCLACGALVYPAFLTLSFRRSARTLFDEGISLISAGRATPVRSG